MRTLVPVFALAVSLAFSSHASAANATPTKAEVEALLGKAQEWLLTQQQPDGAFLPGNKFVVGITAMSVDALTQDPMGIPGTDPRIMKALELLKSHHQADGGTYAKDEGLSNYGTSFTLMALMSAKSTDEAWIKASQNYLFGSQNDDPDSINSGGVGYGSRGKGHEDVVNTSTAIQALRASGVPESDPHMQKALAFLERCQNLSSHNKLPWAKSDGGAVYSPDESKAGGSRDTKEGTGAEQPRMTSYGSVTYALISSYLTLNLTAEDPRVAAALGWVKDNYQFDKNPGMATGKELEGLLYYYAMMAKTFSTLKMKEFELKDGTKADWRADLFAAIKQRAIPTKLDDGREGIMWINSAQRWGEGIPQLGTVYLIRALKAIHASL